MAVSSEDRSKRDVPVSSEDRSERESGGFECIEGFDGVSLGGCLAAAIDSRVSVEMSSVVDERIDGAASDF